MSLFPCLIVALSVVQSPGRVGDDLATPDTKPISQRQPVVAQAPPTSDLSKLSFSELVARMPLDPWTWNKDAREWSLKPEARELRRRVEAHSISDAEWRAELVASDVLHTRSGWLVNEPLFVWVRPPTWLRSAKITAHAVEPELGTVTCDDRTPSRCGNCREFELARQSQLELAPLPPSTTRVVFEVTIEQLNRHFTDYVHRDDVALLWRGRVDVPVRSTSTIEDALPARSNPGLDRAVRASLHAFRPQNGDALLCLTAGGEYAEFPALWGIGLSLEIELWHRGEFIGRTELLVNRAAVQLSSRDRGLKGFATITSLPPEFSSPDRRLAEWELRVAGTSQHLLSVWEAERYWNGRFVVTLDELMSTPK
jgi:hypothetical protein